MRYIANRGYELHEMTDVFRILDDVSTAAGAGRVPGWLSTHPAPQNRIGRISRAVEGLPESGGSRVGRDTYLRRIDGMVFGDNPREGYFENSLFLHPDLRFEIRFPSKDMNGSEIDRLEV